MTTSRVITWPMVVVLGSSPRAGRLRADDHAPKPADPERTGSQDHLTGPGAAGHAVSEAHHGDGRSRTRMGGGVWHRRDVPGKAAGRDALPGYSSRRTSTVSSGLGARRRSRMSTR